MWGARGCWPGAELQKSTLQQLVEAPLKESPVVTAVQMELQPLVGMIVTPATVTEDFWEKEQEAVNWKVLQNGNHLCFDTNCFRFSAVIL